MDAVLPHRFSGYLKFLDSQERGEGSGSENNFLHAGSQAGTHYDHRAAPCNE